MQPQGESSALNVLHAEAPLGDRTADALPVDVAVPTIGSSTPSPEEAAFDLFDHLQGFLRRGVGEQLVDGDGAEDGLDHRETSKKVFYETFICIFYIGHIKYFFPAKLSSGNIGCPDAR